MAVLDAYVQVNISVDNVGPQLAGFGIPLIGPSYYTSGWGAGELVRFYSSLADVAVDFPTATMPEYLAAAAMFNQSPAPATIAIGKGVLPATHAFTLTPVVANAHTYTIYLKGKGVTPTTCTYTSDGSATAAEIVAGLTTAVNAVVGRNFLATGSTTLIITSVAAGDWFSVELDNYSDFDIASSGADPGVATDLAAILVKDQSWYGLVTLYNDDAYIKAAAAWAQSNKKLYFFVANETLAINTASDGTQGTLDDELTLGDSYVAGFWHRDPYQMFAAGEMGKFLPTTPGSSTVFAQDIEGVASSTLTTTQKTNLLARRANFMETVAGTKRTRAGTVFNSTIGFIDVRRDLDYVQSDMAGRVFGVLGSNPKLPYTDPGVAVVEGVVRGALNDYVALGIFAEGSVVVTVPKVANVSSADKTSRTLRNVKWSATLAGAIHSVIVTGVVSV